MTCKHFKIRQKKYKKIFVCGFTNKEIKPNSCFCCEYKDYKPVKRINPVSNKKVTVSKETYNKVFARDNGMCQICGSRVALHLHHIEGRGKELTDNERNCIMLCNTCHLEVVHKNNTYWNPKLKELVGGKYND